MTLTAQQPENNIVRVAYQALAAVLGGTQSLHTNSMDETLALPTEKAVRIALRTQQILAYETGVPNTIDPLAGSYFVESMTDELEREAEEIFAEIDDLGGVVAGIESGYFQARIARSARRFQDEVEANSRLVVGVNCLRGRGRGRHRDPQDRRVGRRVAEPPPGHLAPDARRRRGGAHPGRPDRGGARPTRT